MTDTVFSDQEIARPLGVGGDMSKRAMDVVGALALLILTAPLISTIAMALACARGPVLFRQVRIGRDGRRFGLLKFRTMRPDAEARLTVLQCEEWLLRQKFARDPRVTRFGLVLRRWGLDELPQLINVLRGEMSLVGPRPLIAPETPGYPADRAYVADPAFVAYRAVRPGLTGLWQVSGGPELAPDARAQLDRRYVAERSFGLDLRILLATPMALANRRIS